MKNLLAVLALCVASLGQTTVLPKTTVFNKTTVFGAMSAAGLTYSVTKIANTLVGAFGSPYTITLTAGAPTGSMVLGVCGSGNANAGTAFNWTMADSKTNAWAFASTTNTTWQYLDTGDARTLGIGFIANVTSALLVGDTITFTPSVDNQWFCDFFNVVGAVTSSPLDQISGAATAFSSTQTTASVTPAQQPELSFAAFNGGAGVTFSAYGNLMGSAATGVDNGTYNTSVYFAIEWRKLTATTAGTGTLTQSASQNGASLIFTMKGQ